MGWRRTRSSRAVSKWDRTSFSQKYHIPVRTARMLSMTISLIHEMHYFPLQRGQGELSLAIFGSLFLPTWASMCLHILKTTCICTPLRLSPRKMCSGTSAYLCFLHSLEWKRSPLLRSHGADTQALKMLLLHKWNLHPTLLQLPVPPPVPSGSCTPHYLRWV